MLRLNMKGLRELELDGKLERKWGGQEPSSNEQDC